MSEPIAQINAALEGCYSIERQIGEGGGAMVFRADDLLHDSKVALKVLNPELVAIVWADRFLAEIIPAGARSGREIFLIDREDIW